MCWGAEVHLSRSTQNSHRIGRPSCLENPRPKAAEYSLTESAPLSISRRTGTYKAGAIDKTTMRGFDVRVSPLLLRNQQIKKLGQRFTQSPKSVDCSINVLYLRRVALAIFAT